MIFIDMTHQPDITIEQDARALDWQDRGHLLTNLSNVLDSLEDSTAPNAERMAYGGLMAKYGGGMC